MTPTFALAIPHTPWIPARVNSLAGLLGAIIPTIVPIRVFEDREPNWSWSEKLWSWGASQSTTHLLQLQDDAILAPNFWAALRAMVEAVPDKIIGLQGAHPKFRALKNDGHRWATSRAWMVGVSYIIPTNILAMLVAYRHDNDDEARATNEDEFIAKFAIAFGLDIWHPIPTIVDHDTTIESTYANDGHRFRKPTVTWREFGEVELTRPDFWAPPSTPTPTVTNPHLRMCWMCESGVGVAGFTATGGAICKLCLMNALAGLMGVSK